MTLRVLVAGAGLGGLCLAQGLRGAGVDVRVLERDATPDTRGQGHRLRINDDGVDALSRCLPDDLFQLFRATTNPPYPPYGVAFDHHLEQVASLADGLPTADRQRLSTAANRGTLRQLLLAGLGEGTVQFGREVVSVRQTPSGVAAELADGSTATGDVLVAADGINSAVRAQLLPEAKLVDTGLRSIYGRAILDDHLLEVLPDRLLRGSPRVTGPGGVTLALGAFQPCEPPQRAAARIAPYARLSHVPPYMKWGLVGPTSILDLTRSANLYETALRMAAGWHPALVELIRCADPPSVFALSIRGALPVDPWPTSRVTFLGDAIHATTPAGGTGANVAFRDAALLAGYLTAADRGFLDLLDAIGRYEDRMRDYGFAAATRSLRGAEVAFQTRLPVPALA
jgi:2-polyprenyl-6-methoxyphenol hydroxylase-like FAD-dependent oxidoreductase